MAVTIKTTINLAGIFKDGIFSKAIKNTMINSVKRGTKIIEEAAKKDYLEKRKTKQMPSLIISSFVIVSPIVFLDSVHGEVFCGGPIAPYAIYVDKGHSLRSGYQWDGYEFMLAGMEECNREIEPIIREEFNKASILLR